MSIYNRLMELYRRNVDSNKKPLEDFTTEILVGTLENNQIILDAFCNEVLNIEGQGFVIQSQQKYYLEQDTNCIIDMVIQNADVICFVENKVDSGEGDRQLERYTKVLNNIKQSENKNVYLRYCTKYYDDKEVTNIDFLQYRWRDIYRFLEDYQENKVVEEFQEFLRGEGMNSAGDFNFQDLIVMSQVDATISRMDECLDRVKPKLTDTFGAPYQYDYERLKQIGQYNQYVMRSKGVIGNDGYAEIGVGFRFRITNRPIVVVYLDIGNKNSEFEKIRSEYSAALEDFFDYYYEDEKEIFCTLEKPVSDFVSSSKQNEDICKWFTEKIDKVSELKSLINIVWNV